MNTATFDELFRTQRVGNIEIPKFLYDLFLILPEYEEGLDTASENQVLESVVKWYQGDYGLYSSDFVMTKWPQYHSIVKAMSTRIVHQYGNSELFTSGLVAVYNVRKDLQSSYPIANVDDEFKLLKWWYFEGVKEYEFLSLTSEYRVRLRNLCNARDLEALDISFFDFIVSMRPDLKVLWEDKDAFVAWWVEYGTVEFAAVFDEPMRATSPQPIVFRAEMPSDVKNQINFIGYLEDKTGLGEDARMSHKILKQLGYSTNPIIANGTTVQFRTGDDKKINFVSIPGADTYKCLIKFGKELFLENYTIGAWYWELPLWPKRYASALDVVDEVWAYSPYVKNVFEQVTNKKVSYAPATVVYPDFDPKNIRSRLGIEDNQFIYLCMFDGKSSIYRKNPLSLVKAFYSAFDRSNRDVGIVVKSMHMDQLSIQWKEIKNLIKNDPRVYIIDTELSSDDRFNLIFSCDAYVSPHRAEGFGRIIAEAMLLGKPVVVSNYSGNLVFNDEANSYLVEGVTVPVEKNQYWDYKDQYWFEPDQECLVEQMRLCYFDAAQRQQKAQLGRLKIERNHSLDATSLAYRALLDGVLSPG